MGTKRIVAKRARGLTQSNDAFVDGFVFKEVFLQRKEFGEGGNDFTDLDALGVSYNHAAYAASGVVC